MSVMVRRLPLLMAALIAVGAIALPSPLMSPADAVVPEADGPWVGGVLPVGAVPAGTRDIVPGSVGRSSLFLDATYDTFLKLAWGSRTIWVDSTATIRNTSGAPIDRVEFNTVAARLGAIRLHPATVDGAVVGATISDQTIVVPLGGILPTGGVTKVRVRYLATLRSSLSG
jgi:hypothetical protein